VVKESVPRRTARYQILERLGQGGSGEVFVVRDAYDGREKAMKVMSEPGGARGDEKHLKREFELLRMWDHPGLVKVYDWGRLADGRAFFTMERVRTRPWSSVRGAVSQAALFYQAARALGCLNRYGFLHGDVKPSNLLVLESASGSDWAVKVSDLGTARLLAGGRSLAESGTPLFMAPEVLSGDSPTCSSEVFSMGVSWLSVLDREGKMARLGSGLAVAREAPVLLRELGRRLPRQARMLLREMLSPEPAQRPGSFEGVSERILRAFPSLEGLAPPEPVLPVSLWPGRKAESAFLQAKAEEARATGRRVAVLMEVPPGSLERSLEERFGSWCYRNGLPAVCVAGGVGKLIADLEAMRGLRGGSGEVPGGLSDGGSGAAGTAFEAVVIKPGSPLSPEALTRVVAACGNSRVFFCFMGQKEWFEKSHRDCLKRMGFDLYRYRLKPVGLAETVGFLARALRGERFDVSVARTLQKHSGGNAEMMLRILRSWLMKGALKNRRGVWSFGRATPQAPRGAGQLYRNRWKDLSGAERKLLRVLGVCKDGCSREMLEEMLGWGASETTERAAKLVQEGWLVEDGADGFQLVLEAERFLELRLRKPERKALHLAWARLIRSREGPDSPRAAYHSYRAGADRDSYRANMAAAERLAGLGEFSKAALHAERAAESARRLGGKKSLASALVLQGGLLERSADPEQAVALYRLALRVSGREDPEIMLRLGSALQLCSRYREACRILTRACDLAKRRRREDLWLESMNDLAWAFHLSGKHRSALEMFDRLERTAGEKPALERHLPRCLNRRGVIFMLDGRYAEARSDLREGLRLATQFAQAAMQQKLLYNLGLVSLKLGWNEDAEHYFGRLTRMRKQKAKDADYALALGNWGAALLQIGDYAAALDALRESSKLLLETADISVSASMLRVLAMAERDAGLMAEAERDHAEAFRLARRISDRALQSQVLNSWAGVWFIKGRCEKAARYCRRALELARKIGNAAGEVFAMEHLGMILAEDGEHRAAVELLEKSLTLREAQESDRYRFWIKAELAFCRAALGEVEVARRLVSEVRQATKSIRPGRTLMEIRRLEAKTLIELSEPEEAWPVLKEALALGERFGTVHLRALVKLETAEFMVLRSREEPPEEAYGLLNRAIQHLRKAASEAESLGAIQIQLSAARAMDEAQGLIIKHLAARKEAFSGVKLLKEAARLIACSTSLDRLLAEVMDIFLELTGAGRGMIILKGVLPDELVIALNRGVDSVTKRDAMGLSRSVVKDVLSGESSVIAIDATQDERVKSRRSVRLLDLRTVICIPLRMRGGGVIGALYCDRRGFRARVTSEDTDLLLMFGYLAGVALETAGLHEEIRAVPEGGVDEEAGGASADEALFGRGEFVGVTPESGLLLERLLRAAKGRGVTVVAGEPGVGKSFCARLIHFEGGGRRHEIVELDADQQKKVRCFLAGNPLRGMGPVAPGFLTRARKGTLVLNHWERAQQGLRKAVGRHLRWMDRGKCPEEDPRFQGRLVLEVDCDAGEPCPGKSLEGIPSPEVILIPPLRDRKADIEALADRFVNRYSVALGLDPPVVTPIELGRLCAHPWNGNARELRDCVRRSLARLEQGKPFRFVLSPEESRTGREGRLSLKALLEEVEAVAIRRALDSAGWNVSEAGRRLGIGESAVRAKMKRLGIERRNSQ